MHGAYYKERLLGPKSAASLTVLIWGGEDEARGREHIR